MLSKQQFVGFRVVKQAVSMLQITLNAQAHPPAHECLSRSNATILAIAVLLEKLTGRKRKVAGQGLPVIFGLSHRMWREILDNH